MKITFVTLDDICHGIQCESTKHRAKMLVPYLSDCHINSSDDFIKTCDVIIFQDRFNKTDLHNMQKIKNKTFVMDISFPVWDPYYPYNSNIATFYQMAKLVNYIIVPSQNYKNALQKELPSKHIEVIPTVSTHPAYKQSAKAILNMLNLINEEIIDHKKIFYLGVKDKHVHIRDIRDGWIMQIIGEELRKLNDPDIKFTYSKIPEVNADINYYINWTNNFPLLFKLPKTKCDIIMFTHLEKRPQCMEIEKQILKWPDKIFTMTKHGEKILKMAGVTKPIKSIDYFGISTDYYKKISLGWSGRPYIELKRKNSEELLKLAEDIDSNIFKFIIYNNNTKDSETNWLVNELKQTGADIQLLSNNYELFLNSIDYYLSLSTIEGGPMDILNMAKAGISICARDIGFFNSIQTKDDLLIKDYDTLLKYFKKIEKIKLNKVEVIKDYTWDKFRERHIELFREELGLNAN